MCPATDCALIFTDLSRRLLNDASSEVPPGGCCRHDLPARYLIRGSGWFFIPHSGRPKPPGRNKRACTSLRARASAPLSPPRRPRHPFPIAKADPPSALRHTAGQCRCSAVFGLCVSRVWHAFLRPCQRIENGPFAPADPRETPFEVLARVIELPEICNAERFSLSPEGGAD